MFYPSASSGPPPISHAQALVTLNDDLTLFKTMAKLVLHQIADEMPDLRGHVATQSSSEISASSLRLKGSLCAIAAMPAQQACSVLNRLARIGAVDSYASGFAHLEQEINRLLPHLRGGLAGPQTP